MMALDEPPPFEDEPYFEPPSRPIAMPPTKLANPLPQPPSSVEAEQALLGAILVNNAMYHRVADRLQAIHFEFGVHSRIYETIAGMIDGGKIADVVTVSRFFTADPELVQHGGAQYIARLAASVVTMVNSRFYADHIIDTWRRREIIARAWQAINNAAELDTERDALRIAEELGAGIAALAEEDGRGESVMSLREAMQAAQRATESAVKRGGAGGLPTGIVSLDDRSGGLYPGHLIVIGGRPGMGKSALAQTVASNVAYAGGTVGFWSLEMQPEDIGWREIAGLSGMTTKDQMRGTAGLGGIERQQLAIDDAGDLPLYIFPRGGIGLAEVQRQARSLQRRRGLALIVIDHLQIMRTRGKKEENRRLELGAISGGLKALAKELGVPVMLLSQLSRAVEMRDDKRPQLSDLRETGDIEQDADCVWLLHREEVYLKQNAPQQRQAETTDNFEERCRNHQAALVRCAGVADLNLAKLRFADTVTIKLKFSGARSRFDDIGGTAW